MSCNCLLYLHFAFNLGRVKRIWYLLPMRAAKVQASLRIRAVLPEPPLLAHTSSESRGTFRQKARSLASLNGWACAVKICDDEFSKTQICLTRHICSSLMRSYHNDPKFLDRQVRANRVDPDQTALEWYTLFSMLSASFWTYYPVVKAHCSKFRTITGFFSGCPNF